MAFNDDVGLLGQNLLAGQGNTADYGDVINRLIQSGQLNAASGDVDRTTGQQLSYAQRFAGYMTNPYKPGSAEYAKFNLTKDAALRGDAKAGTELLQQFSSAKGFKSQNPAAADVVKSQPIKNEAFSGLRSVDSSVQYDKEGRPIRNPYLSMTDANGKLLDQFNLTNKIGPDIQLNTQGLDTIRSRALSQAPSPWALLQKQKQEQEQMSALNQANRQQVAGMNTAYNQLASRGGLSAGQRERLAMQGNRSLFNATQGIRNQGVLNNINVDLQDQQQKDQMLMQLPGMDMSAANFAQQQRQYRNTAQDLDIQRGMKDVQGYNAYNSDAYGEAMKAWGAEKSAAAQANAARSSGGGGLFSSLFG